MRRKRTKIVQDDNGDTVLTPDFGEHAVEVEEAQQFEKALDDVLDRAEEVAEMRAAVMDTLKSKGFIKDAFTSAHQLKRKKGPLEAQAWIRQFLLYCSAIGIWEQEDLFDKAPNVPQPTPTLN